MLLGSSVVLALPALRTSVLRDVLLGRWLGHRRVTKYSILTYYTYDADVPPWLRLPLGRVKFLAPKSTLKPLYAGVDDLSVR